MCWPGFSPPPLRSSSRSTEGGSARQKDLPVRNLPLPRGQGSVPLSSASVLTAGLAPQEGPWAVGCCGESSPGVGGPFFPSEFTRLVSCPWPRSALPWTHRPAGQRVSGQFLG